MHQMILNDALLKAISWTLIHSVWQGFILALLAGMVVQFTKTSNSVLRYNCLAGLFVCFIAMAGLTFNYEFNDEGIETITRINLPMHVISQIVSSETTAPIHLSTLIIAFLNRNANLIAMLWFLVFCVKCFGVFRSLSEVYRIRNYRTHKVSPYWNDKIVELSKRLQLQKTITLLESGLVNVPSVTGFFKPMILVPVGLLSNLPHDQIEAILLHELAHIRRRDYGMNLVQRLAETVFFFNPGLLWVSSLLKEERENCCDDMAIGITQNKTKFIKALVSFEEYQINANALTMGFGNKKTHLLNRAQRIIYNNNKSLDVMEKTFLSVGLVLIAATMLACSKISDPSIFNDDLMAGMPTENAIAKKDSINLAKADSIASQADAKAAIQDSIAAKEDARIAIEDARIAKEDARIAKEDSRLAAMESKLANRAISDTKSVAAPHPISQVTRMVTAKTRTDNATETTLRRTESEGKSVSLRTGISGDDLPDNLNSDAITNQVIADLVLENIISSTKNLSYKLSRNSLIVNGILQPQSKYSKLRDKYLKNKLHAICYNYEISTNSDIRN